MTDGDMARLVALIDRLWYGTRLGQAMRDDPQMFAEWYELLEPVDAGVAREAVQELNAEPDRFPPRPGQIARRAQELAEDRRRGEPDAELLRLPTAEERAVAARLPELRARIRGMARAKDPNR
jgi:hypothetical protein